jgi:hypothetical protein
VKSALGQVSDACEVVQEVARNRYEVASENDQPFDIGKFFKDADTKELVQVEVGEFLD